MKTNFLDREDINGPYYMLRITPLSESILIMFTKRREKMLSFNKVMLNSVE